LLGGNTSLDLVLLVESFALVFVWLSCFRLLEFKRLVPLEFFHHLGSELIDQGLLHFR
jgi:hypothetical protein